MKDGKSVSFGPFEVLEKASFGECRSAHVNVVRRDLMYPHEINSDARHDGGLASLMTGPVL